MPKTKNYAEVNTSYTTFFLLSTLALGLLFGSLLPETRYVSSIVIILYVLLLYFIWDFIKQLYDPMQAIFLYATIFLVLPFAMDWLLNFHYARLGAIILIGSYITAGIFELFYEVVIKKYLRKNLLNRILIIDNKIDKSLIKISNEHVYLNEYKGLIFALFLAVAYFTFTYLLFHR